MPLGDDDLPPPSEADLAASLVPPVRVATIATATAAVAATAIAASSSSSNISNSSSDCSFKDICLSVTFELYISQGFFLFRRVHFIISFVRSLI